MEKTMAKIEQLIQEISNLTLLESADLVKALEQTFNISASMMTSGAAIGQAEAGAGKAAEAEKSEFKVELIKAGPDKIKTIKALREVKKDLGLTEAKKMAEDVPSLIFEAAPKADAETAKKKLEEAGAEVKLS